jgi:hypothetical protein
MSSGRVHEFEDVIMYLRETRRLGGLYGKIELTFRGQEIVYIHDSRGYQPGELPLVKCSQ